MKNAIDIADKIIVERQNVAERLSNEEPKKPNKYSFIDELLKSKEFMELGVINDQVNTIIFTVTI